MSCVPLSPKSQNPKALENERLVPPVDVVVVAIDGVVVVPVAVPLVGVDVVTEYGRIELPYAYSPRRYRFALALRASVVVA
jgi:hypothetical protein